MGIFKSIKKKTKDVGEATLDTSEAEAEVLTIPERAAIDTIETGSVTEGLEKMRDDTFEAIDKADAADKKATGYKSNE